jgi:hypothetical protein
MLLWIDSRNPIRFGRETFLGKFDDLLSKEGETVSRYVHSWETSRNSTTNLKVSKWASSADITACVRSQAKTSDHKEVGLNFLDSVILLTKTALVALDVMKWNNKYYDVILVEGQFWKGILQYYKVTCQERLEFLGS